MSDLKHLGLNLAWLYIENISTTHALLPGGSRLSTTQCNQNTSSEGIRKRTCRIHIVHAAYHGLYRRWKLLEN